MQDSELKTVHPRLANEVDSFRLASTALHQPLNPNRRSRGTANRSSCTSWREMRAEVSHPLTSGQPCCSQAAPRKLGLESSTVRGVTDRQLRLCMPAAAGGCGLSFSRGQPSFRRASAVSESLTRILTLSPSPRRISRPGVAQPHRDCPAAVCDGGQSLPRNG